MTADQVTLVKDQASNYMLDMAGGEYNVLFFRNLNHLITNQIVTLSI